MIYSSSKKQEEHEKQKKREIENQQILKLEENRRNKILVSNYKERLQNFMVEMLEKPIKIEEYENVYNKFQKKGFLDKDKAFSQSIELKMKNKKKKNKLFKGKVQSKRGSFYFSNFEHGEKERIVSLVFTLFY